MAEPKRLLVVEDDDGIQDTLRTILESEGYEVVTIADGDAVLDAVATYQPDGIVLDIMLPTKDGVSVLQDLALLAQRPPVLVVSAYAAQSGGEATVAPWPETAYLAKPWELDTLLAAVARLVAAERGAGDEPQTAEQC